MILLKKYKKNIYVARGNTILYKSHFRGLGFRWSRKLKGGPGYTIRLYNKHHLKRIYEKLKMITDDKICLVQNENGLESESQRKRLSSDFNEDVREVTYPNKKVCNEGPLSDFYDNNDNRINHEISEIQSWSEAVETVLLSFPFQLAFACFAFEYLYPQFTNYATTFFQSDLLQASKQQLNDVLGDKMLHLWNNVTNFF